MNGLHAMRRIVVVVEIVATLMKTATALVFLSLLYSPACYASIFGSGSNVFDIEFVTIGNPGNAADPRDGDTYNKPGIQHFGAVANTYRLAKFEISEDMIDKANALGGLGITKDTRGPDKPATNVSWIEAAQFVNWLNTSKGYTPAYKFVGDSFQLWDSGDAGYNLNNPYRNSLASYFLPSVDEWHKAAYYDPLAEVYYIYPTGSDSLPNGINFVGDPNFDAVFFNGGYAPQPNDITNVGVLSPFGTAGQGGNVSEWTETDVDLVNDSLSSARGHLGGNWGSVQTALHSSFWTGNGPAAEFFNLGFRVASISDSNAVPEPTALFVWSLLGLSAVAVKGRRNRQV